MRVLIVDDSAFMRRTLAQLLASDPGIEVVDTARNGEEGLEKTKRLKPDLVTLDIEMPVMDGLTALRRIKSECSPAPAVIICSSLTAQGSGEALRAMRLGASDVLVKDINASGLAAVRDDLVARVRAIVGKQQARAGAPKPTPRTPASSTRLLNDRPIELLVIGSSTGGPPVLEKIVTALPKSLRVPVVIAQHMPALFTQSLAARLGESAGVPVRHATDQHTLVPGEVYVIQGGKHGQVSRHAGGFRLSVSDQPQGLLYKPSVDELFASAASAAGSKALAVILTGMGEDGVLGARRLHAAGAPILAQDEGSCVVYGMPRAVAEAGLALASLSPDELLVVLASALSAGRTGGAAAAA